MKEILKVEIIKIKSRISELDKAKGEGMSSTYYWKRRKNLIDKLNYWLQRYNLNEPQIKQVTEKISISLDEE